MIGYIVFILVFLLTGTGLLAQFEAVKRRTQFIGAAVLLGMGVSTLVVYLLELLHIKLTFGSVLGANLATMLLANIGYKKTLRALREVIFTKTFSLKLYELPFIGFAGYLVLISVWRAYYLPVTPVDTLVGMDLMAKYAAQEGHLVSSVITEPFSHVRIYNQPFYAPFTTISQIIYRLCGFENGQAWLGVVFIAFLLFFYDKMKEMTHPIFAGTFLLLFIAIPELYAYTFMFLTDFSNAVFFGVGAALFYDYFQTRHDKTLWLSALFMGFSVWSRSETVLFMPFFSLLLLMTGFRSDLKKSLIRGVVYSAVPAVFFVLWNVIMFKFYFDYFPKNQFGINETMGLFDIYGEINDKLVMNPILYGYTFGIFAVLTVINLIAFRNKVGYPLLWTAVTLYIGFGLIVYLFPAAAVDYTIKRGFFKFFPVFFLYLASCSLFGFLSKQLRKFEQ